MKFSIIIPIYNVAPYLRACLDSVCAQTFEDWEAICVDDGSTDDCAKIVYEYAAKDNRFVVIHQENAGVSVARNVALNMAKGEWVMMLDGDDRYDVDLLLRLDAAVLKHPDANCFAFSFEEIDINGSRISVPNYPVGAVTSGDGILGECPKGNWRYIHACWDKAYRRSVIEKYQLRFYPGMCMSEDTLFVNKFFTVCDKVVILENEVGYKWLNRGDSATHCFTARILADDLLRFKSMYDWWLVHKQPGLQKTMRFWASALPFLGKSFGHREECIQILLESLIFKKYVIPFIVLHGTIKARCFALLYAILPRMLKQHLLLAL